MPPALKPGVIPLRPLSLSDIFNGAIAYIRANPKATLGFTTIVVIATQLLALVLTVGPLAVTGALAGSVTGEDVSTGVLLGSTLSSLAGGAATWLTSILLSGLLTVVVGRAVFGAGITIGEAWRRLKGRFWALIGFTLLEGLGVAILVAIVFGLIFWIGTASSVTAAVIIGIPLGLLLVAVLIYLWVILSFAPPLIVLERLGIFAAIERSFRLVKNDFWRVFGIRLLALIAVQFIAGAVTIPFSLGGQLLLMAADIHRDEAGGIRPVGRGRRHRPDHHRPVRCRRHRAALHRPPHPCRSVRPRPADRRRVRPVFTVRFH